MNRFFLNIENESVSFRYLRIFFIVRHSERGLLDLEFERKIYERFIQSLINEINFFCVAERMLRIHMESVLFSSRIGSKNKLDAISQWLFSSHKQRSIIFYYSKTPTYVAEYSKRNAFCNRTVDTKQRMSIENEHRRLKSENVWHIGIRLFVCRARL